MASFRNPGSLCVTSAAPCDHGTLARCCNPSPGIVGSGRNGEVLLHFEVGANKRNRRHKASQPKHDSAVPTPKSKTPPMPTTPSTNCEGLAMELFMNKAVLDINFAIPSKGDPAFPHDIFIDRKFFERTN